MGCNLRSRIKHEKIKSNHFCTLHMLTIYMLQKKARAAFKDLKTTSSAFIQDGGRRECEGGSARAPIHILF